MIAGGVLGDMAPAAAANEPTPTSGSVRDVQRRLAELRFLSLSQVDGRLGPRTSHAITAFQQWNGLMPDGIAGPRSAGTRPSVSRGNADGKSTLPCDPS